MQIRVIQAQMQGEQEQQNDLNKWLQLVEQILIQDDKDHHFTKDQKKDKLQFNKGKRVRIEIKVMKGNS